MHKASLAPSGRARRRQAGHQRRHVLESLEPRRLLAAEVISVTPDGALTGNFESMKGTPLLGGGPPSSLVSDDGRYVAFVSSASDLVPGLPLQRLDRVYVRDRLTGTTALASIAPDGTSLFSAGWPSLSGDGRYVTFEVGDPVVPGDTNGSIDLMVRDTVAGTTTLVSHAAGSTAPADAGGTEAAVSRNGRYVVFTSSSTNLVAGFTNPAGNGIFRYDVQSGEVKPVTEAVASNPSIGVLLPCVSDDGNVVSFMTTGPGLANNVYVKDMTTGVTTLVTRGADGGPIDAGGELYSELSGDGRKVFFQTHNAITGVDTGGNLNIFVRDLAAGTTTLVSAMPDGTPPTSPDDSGSTLSSFGGRSVSGDGRFVVFESNDDLTGVRDGGNPDGGRAEDVFVRDTLLNTTRLLSPDLSPDQAREAFFATISADGRYAAFNSGSSPDLSAEFFKLVVVDVATGATVATVNEGPGGTVLDQQSTSGNGWVFSRSGNLLVFEGGPEPVSRIVPGVSDNNGDIDLLAYALSAIDTQAPTAAVVVSPLTAMADLFQFNVNYTDDTAMRLESLGTGDVVVTGPNGFRQVATLVGKLPAAGGPHAGGAYKLLPPGGVFDAAFNGTYTVGVVAGEVTDAAGNALAAGPIGTLTIDVPLGDGPDLQANSLQGAITGTLVGGPAGGKQKLKPLVLSVTNGGNQPAAGAVSVRVVASTDDIYDAADATVAELPNQKLKLAAGKSKSFKLKLAGLPALPDGDYRLFAIVDSGGALAERLESNNAALLATPVHIAAPFSDVGITSPLLTGKLAAGKKAKLQLTARNDGTQLLKGLQPVRVRLTADPNNPAAVSRMLDTTLKLSLKPGATKALRGSIALPADLPPGTYWLVVELLPPAGWTDADATDNIATSAATFTV